MKNWKCEFSEVGRVALKDFPLTIIASPLKATCISYFDQIGINCLPPDGAHHDAVRFSD